jgi:acyl-CoA synthetase (AMP-forming)/AMP-acid ligase II
VRTPNIFARQVVPVGLTPLSNSVRRYLSDPEATKNAHDSNGYFKTGDIAYRQGIYYFIMGRASVDSKYSGRSYTYHSN